MKLKLLTPRLSVLIAMLAFVAYGFLRLDVSRVFFKEASAEQDKSQKVISQNNIVLDSQSPPKSTEPQFGEESAEESGELGANRGEKNKSGIAGGAQSKDVSSTPPLQANDVSGLEMVKRSHALLRDQSFKASVKQRALIFKKEVVSTGTYLQADGGAGGVKIELDIRTEHLDLKVRMFNDGVYFFRETVKQSVESDNSNALRTAQLPTLNRIESVNLRRMSEQLAKDPHWPGRWIAFGGLYLFMQQAQKCFHFSTPTERIIGETKVLVTRGTWKPEKLALVLPEQKDSILESATIDLNRIPPQIPTEIELYFLADGKLKGLPRRIVFYRPDSDMANGGKQIPILVTDYVDAKFIDTPEAREFQFSAEKNEVFDITDNFLLEVRK